MEEIQKQADNLLEEIGICEDKLKLLQADLAAEIATVTGKYQKDLDKSKALLKTRINQLNRLMKKHKKGLFIDPARKNIPGPIDKIFSTRLNLNHGALLYSVQKRVKQAKGMLARLKNHRLHQAIKKVESVNWDELEKWSDKKLAKVGTERIKKELFEYEVNAKK